jgi:hypothetical protein
MWCMVYVVGMDGVRDCTMGAMEKDLPSRTLLQGGRIRDAANIDESHRFIYHQRRPSKANT